MKKIIGLAAAAVFALTACKKDNPPAPEAIVVHGNTDPEGYVDGPDFGDRYIWYTAEGFTKPTTKEVTADKSLQTKVTFGYHWKNSTDYGIYSPIGYPKLVGQEAWEKQNNTIFKIPAFTAKEFDDMIKANTPINAAFIDKAFNEGTVAGDHVNNFEIGDVILFESKNGTQRGILRVVTFYLSKKMAKLECWVK